MALVPIRVELTAESSKDFVFDKPAADYGKGFGFTQSDVSSPGAPWFSPDVDNLDGTMTGTINFPDVVTGSVDVQIYDRQ